MSECHSKECLLVPWLMTPFPFPENRQKEQLSTKGRPFRGMSEEEVFTEVANLFRGQEDLLSEFGQFLPEAKRSLVSTEPLPQPMVTFSSARTPLLSAAPRAMSGLSTSPAHWASPEAGPSTDTHGPQSRLTSTLIGAVPHKSCSGHTEVVRLVGKAEGILPWRPACNWGPVGRCRKGQTHHCHLRED